MQTTSQPNLNLIEKVQEATPPLSTPENTPWDRIRFVRLSKRLTQEDVAVAAGLNTVTIIHAETPDSHIEITSLRLIAQVLGQDVSYLGCFEDLPEDTLGERITKARLYHGFTKREFADCIGINEKTIRLWETSKNKPTKDSLKLIIPFLEILSNQALCYYSNYPPLTL